LALVKGWILTTDAGRDDELAERLSRRGAEPGGGPPPVHPLLRSCTVRGSQDPAAVRLVIPTTPPDVIEGAGQRPDTLMDPLPHRCGTRRLRFEAMSASRERVAW
jgi:hypothetical protein